MLRDFDEVLRFFGLRLTSSVESAGNMFLLVSENGEIRLRFAYTKLSVGAEHEQ